MLSEDTTKFALLTPSYSPHRGSRVLKKHRNQAKVTHSQVEGGIRGSASEGPSSSLLGRASDQQQSLS